MTNGELATICTAIVGGLGTVGGVLRWGINQITGAINTNTSTMLKFVESAARLEVKLDQAHAASLRAQDAVQDVKDEITGVHSVPVPPAQAIEEELEIAPPRQPAKVRTAKTPIGGYPIPRPGTKGDR